MRTLVIYFSATPIEKQRKTIGDSLFCFSSFIPGEVTLVNVAWLPTAFFLPKKVELIIFHYSFLGLKFSHPEKLLKIGERFKMLEGYKIAIPQDEYVNTNYLNTFFKQNKIDQVFTLFNKKEDWEKVYPFSESGVKKFNTVLPGYVAKPESYRVDKLKPHSQRKIDIGYRATKNFFWLGQFALMKWEIAEYFKKRQDSELVFNISTKVEDTFLGNSWYSFLENSRVTLGVESGASLLDKSGKLREEVERYQINNPNADFKKVSQLLFKNLDNSISYFMASPRIFEAAINKTCMVLMEGNYSGILTPNIHYIPLKKDYSNFEDVIEKIKNKPFCESIAEKAYLDLIDSEEYTYEKYVEFILSKCPINFQNKKFSFSTSFLHKFISSSLELVYTIYLDYIKNVNIKRRDK